MNVMNVRFEMNVMDVRIKMELYRIEIMKNKKSKA
jgi:hypothetical protein